MIKVEFADGCTGSPDEICTITAPASLFQSFGEWITRGIRAVAESKSGNIQNPDQARAMQIIVDRDIDIKLLPWKNGGMTTHWIIRAPRSVVDWYVIYYETERAGVHYRTPDGMADPVWEVIIDERRSKMAPR